METIIETVNLTKKFGAFTANDRINIQVREGEIKCIVGENGAGKSTLMNMLYGLIQPTEGHILIRGKRVTLQNPIDAIANGIGMVHQHFKLVPSLTVYENIFLGIEPEVSVQGVPLPFIDRRKEIAEVRRLIDRYKFELNPTDRISDISVGARQRVEILKMLYRDVDILILDEPTAVLTPQEVDDLTVNLRELSAAGKTIIVITHKLREVMALSDSVTVIKQGKVVATIDTKDTNERELAQMMVGRDVVLSVKNSYKPCGANRETYRIDKISTVNDAGKEVLHRISFSVRAGEILGVAGVEGNGQSELVKVLTGIMKSTSGTISINGKEITNCWPDQLRENRIGIIPEDRYAEGLCKDMSIASNCVAGYLNQAQICKCGVLNNRRINEKRDRLIREYNIRAGDPDGNIGQLSGGNAQKVIIAREFDSDPVLMIACQPTRGVDVGSIEFIHSQLLKFRDEGNAVLLISSELSEILSLSDRVIVMYKGSIIGKVDPKTATAEEIGLLMAGVTD